MHGFMDRIRPKPENNLTAPRKVLRLLLVLLSGLLFGILAKQMDRIQGLQDIGTYLGLWILVVTILAAWSRSARTAALNSTVFLLAMVTAYYLYSMILFGTFYRSYFLRWSVAALFASMGGFIVWYSRGNGWIAAFCAALPIGILLTEAMRFIHFPWLHTNQLYFDLSAALLLYILLSRGKAQRLRALLCTAGFGALFSLIRLPIAQKI